MNLANPLFVGTYVWHQVEIDHYFIDRITALEVLQQKITFIKDRAHTCWVDLSCIHPHMNPTLMNVLHNRDSNALLQLKYGRKFDYNMGLSHMSTQRTISVIVYIPCY